MEQKQINQLMISMGRYGIKKLTLKEEGLEISLEKEDRHTGYGHESEKSLQVEIERHLAESAEKVGREKKGVFSSTTDEGGVFVCSPMVGTFYRATSPAEAPFVRPGDKVEEHTVVCIVEAMKVMNEIKAGVSGIVADVLVENAHPVEFGAKLFRITPIT